MSAGNNDAEGGGSHLSESEQGLPEGRLKGRRGAAQPSIPRVSRDRPIPLSFAQERLWFLDQRSAGAAYNIRLAERLVGTLDLRALRRALEVVVARHEILRATFPAVDGRPVQWIAPSIELPFERIDLAPLDSAEREREVRRLIEGEVGRRFDLARGPLLRAWLYRFEDDDHVLAVSVHRIVFDAWSVGVFKRELSAAYGALVNGAPPSADAPEVQYGDFAAWQRSRLQGETLDTMLDYWREGLRDLPVVELPTDRARPAVQSFQGAEHRFEVPSDLHEAVVNVGCERGVTPAMTLLAAFAALLGRYTDGEEVVVGSPVANRNAVSTTDLIGLFANFVILRTDLSGDPTFVELLERVQQDATGAFDNQDLPVERLVDELAPVGDASRDPLFQITFAFQDAFEDDLVLPGLSAEPFDPAVITTDFDLGLWLTPTARGLSGRLVYNSRLFDASTIARMAGHYHHLLAAVVADPAARLSTLPMTSDAERRRMIALGRGARTEYPERPVHELFEDQAEARPDAVAVEFEDQTLTYSELSRRANRVAHYLIRNGVGPEVKVGIALERSVEMVVGILGVLKSGGAYVPLDPGYPKSRLAYMVEDTRTPVLLTQEHLVPDLPEYAGAVVRLDADWGSIASESEEHPRVWSGVENLAYVIYTSGSTGLPKGVCVPHRGINRPVLNTDYCQVEPGDRVAQASNASFDAATFEIWGGLLNGARLIGISKDVILSARPFAEALREHRITTLFLTTALFNQLSLEVPDVVGTLRHLMFGGELVDADRVRAVLEQGPPQRLLHVYGPTECTTFSTWYEVHKVPEDATTVPIGRPISNSTMFVLDHQRNPVPVGVPGELYLGGDGLAGST